MQRYVRRKTHCVNGHEKVIENIGSGNHCKPCDRLRKSVDWYSGKIDREKKRLGCKAAYLRRKGLGFVKAYTGG